MPGGTVYDAAGNQVSVPDLEAALSSGEFFGQPPYEPSPQGPEPPPQAGPMEAGYEYGYGGAAPGPRITEPTSPLRVDRKYSNPYLFRGPGVPSGAYVYRDAAGVAVDESGAPIPGIPVEEGFTEAPADMFTTPPGGAGGDRRGGDRRGGDQRRPMGYGGVPRQKEDPKFLLPESLGVLQRDNEIFYYPENFLEKLYERFQNGEISQEAYDFHSKKYLTGPVGLTDQIRQFDDAIGEKRVARAQRESNMLAYRDYVTGASYDDLRRRMEEQDAKSRERVAEREARYDKAVADAKAAQDSYLSMKVDPSRHWTRSTVPGVMLSAIAQGLGAFGSALTKTPNYAAQIIKDTIDQDIDAQKADIAKARDVAQMKQGVVKFFYDQIGDAEQAANLARETMYIQAMRDIDAWKASFPGKIHQARAEEMKGFFELERGKQDLQVKRAAATGIAMYDEQKRQAEILAQQRAAAWAANRRKREDEEAMLAEYGYLLDEGDLKNYVRGGGLVMPGTSQKDVYNVRNDGALYMNLEDNAIRFLGVLEKSAGGGVLTPADKAELEQFGALIQRDAIKEFTGKVSNQADREIINKSVGGDVGYVKRNLLNTKKRVVNYLENAQRALKNKHQAVLLPGQTTEYVGDDGKLRVRFKPTPSNTGPLGRANVDPGVAP